MKKISIYRPSTVDEAIQILSQHGTSASVYAGGTDLLIRLKNRLEQAPSYLVDIKKIDHLRYIKDDPQGGVEIGAATKLAELADSRLLQDRYPMLVEAILKISSPELRNTSTLGGDLLQEVWCQYLRGGYSCWRNGGYICYGAIGDNSYYHSAMGGRLCYAVYPGDAATALIPFDARAKLATPDGVKELSIEQLVPGDLLVDGRIQSHVVRFNEILTSVVIPRRSPACGPPSRNFGLAEYGTSPWPRWRSVFSFAARPLTTLAWCLEASPASPCAKRPWRVSSRAKP
jgi:xanthine dehydrogenase YagS FAD-binding subunit